jgi:class 3 adenylate cyclase/ligand-binding sensor domain-containing protein
MAAVILLVGVARAQISPEAGAFYSKTYSPELFGAKPQNWAAVQDSRGFMYFGNTDGVLEYGGSTWRKIALSNGGEARALTVDGNGTVYVGGQNEIGLLKPDATGTLNYVSLLDQVPEQDRQFGPVWKVCATKNGIFFGSTQRIFRWRPDGMKVWRPVSTTRFGLISIVNGDLYVQDGGLFRLASDYLEAVPGGEKFLTGSKVRSVFSFSGSLMAATREALYRSDGKTFTKWETAADSFLRDSVIDNVLPLRDGDLAIGTVRGGLLLMAPDGRRDRVIDSKSGIGSSQVNSIYADGAGSLWLMLAKGIAHVEIEQPVTYFADHEGLDEIVISIQRHNGTIYAGTMTGLSRLVVPASGGPPHFDPVPGILGQVAVLLSTPGGLLAAGQTGIYDVDGAVSKPVLPGVGTYDLSLSIHDSHLLYAVGRDGLHVFRFENGRWERVRDVPAEGQEFRTVLEDSDGRIWVTTRTSILLINLTSSGYSTERYGEKDGVASSSLGLGVFRLGSRVVFATPKGLLQFDHERNKFEPCRAFGSMFADGTHSVSLIRESPQGDIWISSDDYNGILHNHGSGAYSWEQNPLARTGIKELYALYLDSDNVAWAAGSDGGLVRYSVWSSAGPVTAFNTEIQAVQIDPGEKTLFGGTGQLASLPRIPHSENAVRFQFTAPAYDDESRTQYQVRLDKLDHGWSKWSSETQKEYMNLSGGSYTFHVRARDLFGRISDEDQFAFRVLPPWYLTWWAYLLWACCLLGAMWAVLTWRLRALAEANRKLELIIEERTEEIRKQRDTIKQDEEKARSLLLNILPASVAEELSETGSVTPLGYDDITVCFTDFVGFTLSSEGQPAAKLVAALHKYFTAFDAIIGRYGLEKLKTIGDSYMFVSGLPNRSSSHAVDAVMAALEIADYVANTGEAWPGWRIRIGIHSGPVVAGVVGVRKFAFDIWGETVNFASRFESSGAANRVNISAQTFGLVREFIECEARGPILIKEKRKLEMYFVRGIHPDLLGTHPDGISDSFSQRYYERFGHLPPAIPLLKSPPLAVAQHPD